VLNVERDARTVENLTGLADRIAAGTLVVPVAGTYSLDDVVAAFTELESMPAPGKIIVTPERITDMKIAIIGATGFVGAAVLDEALAREHDVTAIVRDATRLPADVERLTAVTCDIRDRAALASAIAKHDVVISAYNPGHDIAANPHLYREVVEGAVAMIDAVKRAGIPYFVYLGGAASLFREPGLRVADDPRFPDEYSVSVPASLEHFAEDKRRSIDIPLAGRVVLHLFEHDRSFEWSYLSPPLFLQPGSRSGQYVRGTDTFVWDGDRPAAISIADYAVAVLDEAEQRAGRHEHYTVTGA